MTSPTWTAPTVNRPGGSLVAPERELLSGLLAWHRATFLDRCAGLTAEQLATASTPPSNLTLLGLLRHLCKVERIWLRQRVAGEPVEPLHGFGTGQDLDFEQIDPTTAEADYAAYLAEIDAADAAVASLDLDAQFEGPHGPFTLRFVYAHLIGEYARHNGHADLIRERLDGRTGA